MRDLVLPGLSARLCGDKAGPSSPAKSVCSLPEGKSSTCHTGQNFLGGHVSQAGHV
jgi:hypothetical protein